MTAVTATEWLAMAERLAARELDLLALWGEPAAVHMAVMERAGTGPQVVSLACPDRRFPSIARFHPPAGRLERAVHDLFGLIPEDAPDRRPWLDHGAWGVRHPLGESSPVPPGPSEPYPFLPAEGESLHQIPVGPVHAGIIEPGGFRFAASGETVVRLEERLGYVHKGIEGLMAGADLTRGAKLAGRTSGDSTVVYAFAFARAAEAATGADVPPRAVWLRALMAELERLANHLGDIGAVCNDAAFSLMHTHCGVLRELVLRASDACFGHRLMMDRIVPGGVTTDIGAEGIAKLRQLGAEMRHRFAELVELYDNTTSLQDRTAGTGFVRPELVRQWAAGGYVGRAAGRAFDARSMPGYPPYDQLTFEVPVRAESDVDARVWIRILEVEQSLSLLEQILARLPAGPIRADVPATGGEGMALIEGSGATSSSGSASQAVVGSSAATCAIRPGFSGRSWRRRSRATSSPTSPCATSPSTVPIRATISRESDAPHPLAKPVPAGAHRARAAPGR